MSLKDDVQVLIDALIEPGNGNNFTSAQDVSDSFALVLDNLDNLGSNYYGTIITSDTAPPNPADGATVTPLVDGIYTNFSNLERSKEICYFEFVSSAWVKKVIATNSYFTTGEVASGDVEAVEGGKIYDKMSGYPFRHLATFEGEDARLKDAIIDIQIKGGDKNWRVAPFNFDRNSASGHYIRLVVYKENDTQDTLIGGNGVIAIWQDLTHTEPTPVEGKIIEKINIDTFLYTGIDSIEVVVDWGSVPDGGSYGIESYVRGGFDQKIFEVNGANTYVSSADIVPLTTQTVFPNIPIAEVDVWNQENTYSILPEFKSAVLDIQMFGSVNIGKDYAVGQFRLADDGTRNFIGVYEYDAISGLIGNKVALWDANPSYIWPVSSGGRQIDTVELIEQNSSGITMSITVDFAKLPTGITNPSDGFPVENFKFGINLLRNTSVTAPVTGNATIDFQVNGVDSRITTPTAYDSNGKPSYVLMHCHGNTQDHTYQGSTIWKNFCIDNNIAIITTDGQDAADVIAPFTSNASGWGNYVHLQRYIALYKYCQDNFNLSPNIILSCASMGGLVAGQLMYNKPFPITACFLIGPVPDLSYIFANGGENRREPIRNAYGMDAGGADDANLELFIQGYDWYDLGLADIAGTNYKFAFPKFYIEVGNGDATFSTDFGGTAKYMEIVNAINAAGGFIFYHEVVGATHDSSLCFDKFISDGVFQKELGI